MTPQQWSIHSEQAAESIGRNVSSAVGHALNLMGMLQNAQQQKDVLALRTQEFQLNQKVQTGTLELNQNKQKLMQEAQLREQEDLKQMQFGAEQLHQGNFDWEPEKPWGSIKSAATWEKMKGGLMTATAVGQAQLRMNDDLGKMASFDPTIPAALDATAEVYGKGSKEWLEDFRSYKREMDAANEAKAAREFQMKQAAMGARQAEVAQIRAENALDIAAMRTQGTVEAAQIRASKAGQWMSHAQWTAYKARLDAINQGSGKPDAKHAAMNKVDEEFGVPHTIEKDNSATSGLKQIKTKAERDALPPGTQYIGPDGVIATKQ